MNRTVYDGGNYLDIQRGISLGCPLSPLMAALYLSPLDKGLEETGGFYARFMDDWVLVLPTRWKLRRAVARANHCLDQLSLDIHPKKTLLAEAGKDLNFSATT